MLNDSTLFQILLMLSLLFIMNSSDLFFLIVNSIFYLLIISAYAWLNDFDVFVNFLVIIDLGLFFIFFIFFVSNSNLFTSKLSNTPTTPQLILWFTTLLVLNLFVAFASEESSIGGVAYPALITFFDWYSVLGFVFSADLQLMSELYFNFNLFEFIIMNFYIYLSLFLVYYFFSMPIISDSIQFLLNLNNSFFYKLIDFSNFVKFQDFEKQRNSVESVRVWSKTSTSTSTTKL